MEQKTKSIKNITFFFNLIFFEIIIISIINNIESIHRNYINLYLYILLYRSTLSI